MPRTSAGIALYRRRGGVVEVLLVHPGGPLWTNRDQGAWTFPKGEYGAGEDPVSVALREFREETGQHLEGVVTSLGTVKQKGGKVVQLFAMEGACDAGAIRSDEFTMEWPPKSGRTQSFPEVDRAGWFPPELARRKLLPSQAPFLDRLYGLLAD